MPVWAGPSVFFGERTLTTPCCLDLHGRDVVWPQTLAPPYSSVSQVNSKLAFHSFSPTHTRSSDSGELASQIQSFTIFTIVSIHTPSQTVHRQLSTLSATDSPATPKIDRYDGPSPFRKHHSGFASSPAFFWTSIARQWASAWVHQLGVVCNVDDSVQWLQQQVSSRKKFETCRWIN